MNNTVSQTADKPHNLLQEFGAYFSAPRILSVRQTATHLTRGRNSELCIELHGWGQLKLNTREHPKWHIKQKLRAQAKKTGDSDFVWVSAPKGATVRVTYKNIWWRSSSTIQVAGVPEKLQPIPSHEVGRKQVVTQTNWLPRGLDIRSLRAKVLLQGFKAGNLSPKLRFGFALKASDIPIPRVLIDCSSIGRMVASCVPKSIKLLNRNDVSPTHPVGDTKSFLAHITIPKEC